MMNAIDLRKGKTIVYNDELVIVHDARHVAKGNKGSYMQTKLKNMKSGKMFEVRFNVTDRVEIPFVDSKEYEFLYKDGDNYIVMDGETYDQIPVHEDLVADAAKWLIPNQKVTCQIYQEQVISFEVPFTVTLEVVEAPPVVKGATVTNQPKDVVLETGTKIRVPGFVSAGERVNVDTRTGEYLERAK